MSEKITLSQVERFALTSAREKAQEAQVSFNDLVSEVVNAHNIAPNNAPDWQFTRDFSSIIHVPQKKERGEDVGETGKGGDAPKE
jgi:hypothetical protein